MTEPLTLHPAKFSDPILDAMGRLVRAEVRRAQGRRPHGALDPMVLLDPLAGVGRIHQLAWPGRLDTIGCEIQARWAACHSRTLCVDAMVFLAWCARHGITFDIVASSPTYGNRLSDHHDARDGSTRRSYRHDYGEPLADNNSGQFPWGTKYRTFHVELFRLLYAVTAPGGLVLWNTSYIPKNGQLIGVTEFHRGVALAVGYTEAAHDIRVTTKRLMGVGVTAKQAAANPDGPAATDTRAPHESIMRFRKPED